jgi:Bleomycin resistance protein-like N-terminal
MDKVVHFEIPADDTARAKEFYSSIFDWQLNDADMGGGNIYTTLMTVPVDEQSRIPTEPGAINGGLMQRTKDTPGPGRHDRRRCDRRHVEEGRGWRRERRPAQDRDPETWVPSPTSRTARATWSVCGRPWSDPPHHPVQSGSSPPRSPSIPSDARPVPSGRMT